MSRAAWFLSVMLVVMMLPGCLRACRPTPEPEEGEVTVTLYFADFMAQHTIPEDREIDLAGRPLALRVVEELIEGPRTPGLHATIPGGTRVLGVTVVEGVARVDFSRELVDNHPGGSAGEAMTLRSLIFTLTDLEGVEGITILVEGEPISLLAGHVELVENMGRGPILTFPIFVDEARAGWLQQEVDAGRQTWRCDPLEVARRDGRMAGFRLTDAFRLLARTGGEAVVAATHGGKTYTIKLRQTVRTGPRGIWTITDID